MTTDGQVHLRAQGTAASSKVIALGLLEMAKTGIAAQGEAPPVSEPAPSPILLARGVLPPSAPQRNGR